MQTKAFFLRQYHVQHRFYSLPKTEAGTVVLVRHAQSEHNILGCCAGFDNHSKPTKEGLENAHKAAKYLSKIGVKFDIVYVSPLRRAYSTAQVFVENLLPIEIRVHEALAERNFGAFTGLSKAEIEKILGPVGFQQYIHDKNYFPPDIGPGHKYFQSEKLYGKWPDNHKAESYQCVINRLNPFLNQLKTEVQNDKKILIVGHSHSLKITQMLLFNSSFEQGIEKFKLDYVTPVQYKMALNSNNQLMVREKMSLIPNHPLPGMNT